MRTRPDDRVAILAYEGLRTFEFGIAVELFALERPELDAWYDTVVVTVDGRALRAAGGITVEPAAGPEAARDVGTLVVPGWHDLDGPLDPCVRDLLVGCVARGGRVLGICSGTFALAQAGLLDGRRATTHWAYVARLAAQHPRVDVAPDVLYVDAHEVLTSAGSAAGIDAGLHLVREDWGAAVAANVARRMVSPPHRDGGQAQYVHAPAATLRGDDPVARVQAWALAHLEAPLTVAELAAHAGWSTRTLQRRFAAATGASVGAWVLRQRVARAQELLVATDLTVEQVARRVGFGSAGALRHHVRRVLGTSPTAYRARFAERPDR